MSKKSTTNNINIRYVNHLNEHPVDTNALLTNGNKEFLNKNASSDVMNTFHKKPGSKINSFSKFFDIEQSASDENSESIQELTKMVQREFNLVEREQQIEEKKSYFNKSIEKYTAKLKQMVKKKEREELSSSVEEGDIITITNSHHSIEDQDAMDQREFSKNLNDINMSLEKPKKKKSLKKKFTSCIKSIVKKSTKVVVKNTKKLQGMI